MNFTPGQQVLWLYEPRGGWGYQWWIPAVVVKVGPRKVTIEANLAKGGVKQVSVKPERLRPKP